MKYLLAADIGATHSRFALFRVPETNPDSPRALPLELEREQWLDGALFPSFAEVLRALRTGKGDEPPFLTPGAMPDAAVIAPAGPIQGDTCRMPNLPWLIRGQDVREALGIPRVFLINDFAAQAYACLMPDSIDAVPVLEGAPYPGAPIAVVGAGTGFGQALLLCPPARDGESGEAMIRRFRQAVVLPSEGGHAEMPFVGLEEFAFAAFAAKRAGTPRLIGDAVITGSGLTHIFAYHTGRDVTPREAAAEAAEHPLVMEWYARFYARACRNYVLYTLALGGLYITAGMALRVPVLEHPAFAEEFYHSAAQRPLLERIPVRHVRKPQAGLWGAALYGLLRMSPAPDA